MVTLTTTTDLNHPPPLVTENDSSTVNNNNTMNSMDTTKASSFQQRKRNKAKKKNHNKEDTTTRWMVSSSKEEDQKNNVNPKRKGNNNNNNIIQKNKSCSAENKSHVRAPPPSIQQDSQTKTNIILVPAEVNTRKSMKTTIHNHHHHRTKRNNNNNNNTQAALTDNPTNNTSKKATTGTAKKKDSMRNNNNNNNDKKSKNNQKNLNNHKKSQMMMMNHNHHPDANHHRQYHYLSKSNPKNETTVEFQQVNQQESSSSSNDKGHRHHHPKRTPRNKSRTKKINYPDYVSIEDCNRRYASGDKHIIRGKLRVMPGGSVAFVSCDRGIYTRDVIIASELERNRALDGDLVYLQVLGPATSKLDNSNTTTTLSLQQQQQQQQQDQHGDDAIMDRNGPTLSDYVDQMSLDDIHTQHEHKHEYEHEHDDHNHSDNSQTVPVNNNNTDKNHNPNQLPEKRWNDDEIQQKLWNPLVNTRKPNDDTNNANNNTKAITEEEDQYRGCVIHVVPPNKSAANTQPSEINPSDERYRFEAPKRSIVGTLMKLPGENSNFILFVPNNRSLPRFITPPGTRFTSDNHNHNHNNHNKSSSQLYKAEYVYGSWKQHAKWAPCINLKAMGQSCSVQDETEALLTEFAVNHGDFTSQVYKVVEDAVKSGRIVNDKGDLEWEPTPEMLKDRRDFRNERIFTIDPTTAKDLDDALHIKKLPDGRVEIGVHIADVSYFVSPGTAVDHEAVRRATTVYLVDRTIPMLPRPLCEIACSLNENVERLAFSCVWRMNMDGTMQNTTKAGDDIWYGRSVIRSCARLDYATAQNIIDKKVATGEKQHEVDTNLWPQSRQPTTGQHTIDQVASDVRLMHAVAMARRRLRLENGALTLNGVKLTFQLQSDGETPNLCQPYPIRDSNRLVEEYMLLANFLVAQRLITHTGGLAMLRHHPCPERFGLESVVDIAQASGYHVDAQSSQSLQKSLNRLARQCGDELVLQCVTELLMVPMRPADYIAAGSKKEEEWRHFALNIPYYTHFTSPIRRYADIMVHRLLQATIDNGDELINDFYVDEDEMQNIAGQCNEMRMNAKKASERSDRVFLSLYLKSNPIDSVLGVVISVGEKTFTTFVPSLGVSTTVFVEDHTDAFHVVSLDESSNKKRQIQFVPKEQDSERNWSKLVIRVFTKIEVSCHCKETPPIDVRLFVKGPWQGA